jgi:hypothetical protein
VTPDGDVICDSASIDDKSGQTIAQSAIDAMAATVSNSWGPNKKQLLLDLFDALDESEIPDSPNLPRRARQIVQSVKQLLTYPAAPPSILLFNFSDQPGNVMGNYYLNKAELMRMHKLAEVFENVVQP